MLKCKYWPQLYQQAWNIDPTFELWVEAWMAYHEAADKVDGHLPLWDRSLNRAAIRAGNWAMEKVFKDNNIPEPTTDSRKEWCRAKIEALRRLGK